VLLGRDPAVGVRDPEPRELRWSRQGRRHRLRAAFVASRAEQREVICVQPEQLDRTAKIRAVASGLPSDAQVSRSCRAP
jgi:methionyl-tRNA formyltransferase